MAIDINKELIKLEIKAGRKCVGLANEIIKLVPKFDGKQPTKRFDTALKTIDPRLSFGMEYNSFKITYWNTDNRVDSNKGWYYTRNNHIYILHASIRSSSGDGICQNGVIIAATLIADLQLYVTRETERLTKLEAEIENIHGIMSEYKDLTERIEEFISRTSYVVREYYGLNFGR